MNAEYMYQMQKDSTVEGSAGMGPGPTLSNNRMVKAGVQASPLFVYIFFDTPGAVKVGHDVLLTNIKTKDFLFSEFSPQLLSWTISNKCLSS